MNVSEVTGREWKNTCRVCSSTRPQEHCPDDCPGRQKYVTKIDLHTLLPVRYFLPDASLVFSCSCDTCNRKQVAHTNNQHCQNTPCRALRGYEVDTLKCRKMLFCDLHVCRVCSTEGFYEIQAMPFESRVMVMVMLIVRGSSELRVQAGKALHAQGVRC